MFRVVDKGKKTKKRRSSEEETGTTEAAGATPERKRARETSKDKEIKKAKFEGETETTKKFDSDIESDAKTQKAEVGSAKETETLPTAKTEKKSDEQVFMLLLMSTCLWFAPGRGYRAYPRDLTFCNEISLNFPTMPDYVKISQFPTIIIACDDIS